MIFKLIFSSNFSFFILAGTYANVTVSVIFGFLNFLLWLSSIWFVYKETKYFKSRTAQQQQPPQNNFSNIAPATIPEPRLSATMD